MVVIRTWNCVACLHQWPETEPEEQRNPFIETIPKRFLDLLGYLCHIIGSAKHVHCGCDSPMERRTRLRS